MSTPTSNAVRSSAVDFSGDVYIDSLLYVVRWGSGTSVPTNLTYSFPTPQSIWASPTYSELNEPTTTGVIALSPIEQNAARLALTTLSQFANVSFTQLADSGQTVGEIRIAYTPLGADADEAAHAYLPSVRPNAGDIWINSDTRSASDGMEAGSFDFLVLLHELGHALGLKHPHETVVGNPYTLDPDFDQIFYTVMSYNVYPGLSNSDYGLNFYPTTPMPLDIAALEYLYGPNLSRNTGNTTYTFNQGSDYLETILDSGGIDTIVWNATTEHGDIDLRPAFWSDLGNPLLLYDESGIVFADDYNVTIYDTTVIENAVGGAADDDMYGNDVANRLEGRAGHDNLYGYDGNDTLLGGDGNDHLYGRAATGGADGADSLDGGAGSDYLQGNAGNDTLDGGDGSDRLNGGAADDVIRGGAGNDTANGNLGNDMLNGGGGDDSLRGGQGNDTLVGSDGNDLLSGDLGVDMLTGGAGSDRFVFSANGSPTGSPDRITDFAAGDSIALGFSPFVFVGSPQSSAASAQSAAQLLFDGRDGNGEVAAIQVGADTYLFYGAGGGATIDSAIILAGVTSSGLSAAAFA